jgi:hypothetical protein
MNSPPAVFSVRVAQSLGVFFLFLLLLGKNKSKMFWNMLKGPRDTFNPSQIIDPVSKTVMFEEKVEIETSVNILVKLVQT